MTGQYAAERERKRSEQMRCGGIDIFGRLFYNAVIRFLVRFHATGKIYKLAGTSNLVVVSAHVHNTILLLLERYYRRLHAALTAYGPRRCSRKFMKAPRSV